MIAIDLSKQQELDADPKVIQQINFTGNLDWAAGANNIFIIEEAKKNHFRFFIRKFKSIVNVFHNFILL